MERRRITMFLFTNTVNIIVTVAVVVFLLLYLILQRIYFKKKGDDLKKLPMIILYIGFFLLLAGGTVFLLYSWGVTLETLMQDPWQQIWTFIISKTGSLIITVVIILVVSFLLKLIKSILNHSAKKEGPNQKRKITMLKVTYSLVNYTFKIVALLVILAVWGVDVLPALAGLGILGLVIGLGAQSLIKDLIAGVFIIFEHHFDVGDTVEINGFKGVVTEVGLKSTRVKNWKNDLKTFANGNIAESINFSKDKSLAVVNFGIAYKENIQDTIDLLVQEFPRFKETQPNLLELPTIAGVTELANSSVNIRVVAKTETETHYGVERAMLKFIKEVLDENNIEIPFPQVVVHQEK
jgi:small conductance mechanosensitive channel